MGFTKAQEEAIQRTIELYSPIAQKCSPKEWERRIKHINNQNVKSSLQLYEKHKNKIADLRQGSLRGIQKAVIVLFGHPMETPPKDLDIDWKCDDKKEWLTVYVKSTKFCPRLAAFKRLEIRPDVCSRLCYMTTDESSRALVQEIDPWIYHLREYPCRPIADYCQTKLIVNDPIAVKALCKDPNYSSGMVSQGRQRSREAY